ncbi:MAG: hypothetical protein HRU20_01945 [Pseudomonadales bacterium]|nr:hypothetical protein [Pseudomonadales bacterium]
MLSDKVSSLLAGWEKQGQQKLNRIGTEILLSCDDKSKIAALSEIYHLSEAQLLSSIINSSLKEIEQAMPYKAGDKIIREEEGEPIYEDIGPTPAYLQAKKRKQQEFSLSVAS